MNPVEFIVLRFGIDEREEITTPNCGETNAPSKMSKNRLREYLYSGTDVDLVFSVDYKIFSGSHSRRQSMLFYGESRQDRIGYFNYIIFIVVGPISFPPSARIISRLHRIPFERGENVFIR